MLTQIEDGFDARQLVGGFERAHAESQPIALRAGPHPFQAAIPHQDPRQAKGIL
jgi:hypothetical protein